MKITLQNIGIIRKSDILLEGLTVITGQNNSGKTTVGKVVYSLLDAVSNIQNKARIDRIYYIRKKLVEIESSFELFRFLRISRGVFKVAFFGEDSTLNLLRSRSYIRELSNSEVENFAHQLFDELSSLDITDITNSKEFSELYSRIIYKNDDPSAVNEMFKMQIDQTLEVLKELFNSLSRDPELIDYTRENINQTLRVEFANQIQPVSKPTEKSRIKLTEKDLVNFDFEIFENKVVNDGKPVFFASQYKRTYFIDDPFIIDAPPMRISSRDQEMEGNESIFNVARVLTHDNKLRSVLRNGKQTSVFEQIILNEALGKIEKQIDQVIPGQFEFNSEGDYYVQQDGSKLRVANLATGSKMFSILKILLEKGEIDETTMLVLDEPEAHLHPNWQNKFAEIVVLLVKELNVNILLTTHSPNFMLAIDAYMRKYDISSKTNFYQTKSIEDGFVEYECVNDNMNKIYADFLQYLSEVKVLRNDYVKN